jgi:hypothetical protein
VACKGLDDSMVVFVNDFGWSVLNCIVVLTASATAGGAMPPSRSISERNLLEKDPSHGIRSEVILTVMLSSHICNAFWLLRLYNRVSESSAASVQQRLHCQERGDVAWLIVSDLYGLLE